MNQRSKRWTVIGLATICLTGIAVQAHVDQEKLREYSWKSRTEIHQGGKSRSVQLMLMRYDTRGELQTTLLSGTADKTPDFGLRGQIAEKKKKGLLKKLTSLNELAESYGRLPQAQMRQLMSSAAVVPDGSAQPRMVRAAGTNVVQLGDSMTVWADAASRRLRKVEIITAFEEKTVRVVSEYQDLANGPTVLTRSVLQYPSDELQLTVDNFEYVKAIP